MAGESPWRNSCPGSRSSTWRSLTHPADPCGPAITRLTAVAFSPDQPTLAMAGYGGAAGLLDVQNGQILDLFENRSTIRRSHWPSRRADEMLAMAVGDKVHVVRVTRSLHGETVAARLGSIRQLAISPDESLLALGRENGSIIVWDVRAKQVLQILNGHGLAVFGVAFMPRPGGVRLVSVGGDGLVQIWDPRPEVSPCARWMASGGAVYSLAVRRDGRQIATGGEDGVVRTWDPATGVAELPPLEHGASISALAYDPSGTVLASGGMDRTVRVWSAKSGRRRLGSLSHPNQLTSLAFSPDGQLLAGGGGATDMGGSILIWDASSGRSLPRSTARAGWTP